MSGGQVEIVGNFMIYLIPVVVSVIGLITPIIRLGSTVAKMSEKIVGLQKELDCYKREVETLRELVVNIKALQGIYVSKVDTLVSHDEKNWYK